MQILKKKQQNERERKKRILLKIIGLIICIGAPILTYFVSGGEYHRDDGIFIVLLYFMLIMTAAGVLAIDEGIVWWLMVCLYAAMWMIMLISVPSANPERIMTDPETQMWLRETFAYSLAFALFVSGVFGLIIKFIIRQLKAPD